MSAVYFDADVSDDIRRAKLFEGDIFIQSETSGSRKIVELARGMLEAAFAPADPRKIHETLFAEATANILSELKPRFIHHPDCKKAIREILEEHGADLDKVYFDVPRLRSAYPSHYLSSGIAYAFHPHRDTWYSAPMCQINWWIPVYPLDPDNSMGFYPNYFDQAVDNNSERYNYYEWNIKSRLTAAQHVKSDPRDQPKPQQTLQGNSLRYLPPPGGMILFSGAQLHETVPNTTNVARYSIDFRTVHHDDVVLKRGARNIDSRCTGTTMRDYLRASDLVHLPTEAIALYDDDSAKRAELLYFGDKLVAEGSR